MRNKLYIISGILLILYVAAVNIKSATRIAFSAPVIILGAVMIIYGYKCEEILEYINKIEFLRKSVQLFKICLIFLLCGLTIIEGIIICYPKHDTSDSDYILVLGAGLKDGYNPSATLRYRLNAAIDCVETYGNNGMIVVSGGQGGDEKIPEAEAMKKYLMEHGVPEERILVEDKSTTTDENFEYSRSVIESDSGRDIKDISVKIVTTDFHAFRSRFLAQRNEYSHVTNYSGETVWYLVPILYLREGFAVVKSYLFD